MNHSSTTRRTLVVTARGHYAYEASGRFIQGEGVTTSAVNAKAARLAVYTLASELDLKRLKALRWAAAMIFFMFRKPKSPQLPSVAHFAPRDRALALKHGYATPRQNWQAEYREWARQQGLIA